MYKDATADPYSPPHWQANPKRRYPFLYKEGKKLRVRPVVWGVPDGINPRGALYVKGIGNDDINIDKVPAIYDPFRREIVLPGATASKAFDANKTKYYNPFTITWSMSDDDGATWHDAGVSDNDIYVCLRGPRNGTPIPFRTVVHLACSNDGATDAGEAVDRTWALFSSAETGPANVNGWNETDETWTRPLYYYQAGTNFSTAQNPVTVPGLLKVGTAECVAWKHLLHDAWIINGANAIYIIARAAGTFNGHAAQYFLVKEWTFNAATPGLPANTWQLILNWIGGFPDMVPPPAGGFGDLTNENNLPGQNSFPPSEKMFSNHQFLWYDGRYYDPSYGVNYDNEADFTSTAVNGFAYLGHIFPTWPLVGYYVQPPGAGGPNPPHIKFSKTTK